MTHPHSTRAGLTLLLLLGLFAATAAGADDAGTAEDRAQATVKGRVFGDARPLAAATVFAYEVVSNTMKRVVTDRYGHFLFGSLPAGMYQIVAYKQGFAPSIKPLLRRSAELHQFVDIRMKDEPVGDVREAEGYWAVRNRIPTDVLREINTLIVRSDERLPGATLDGAAFAGQMLAHGGTEQLGGGQGEAQLTTAQVGLHGHLGDLRLELDGQFQQLLPQGALPDAAASSVALAIGDRAQAQEVTLAAVNSHQASLRQGEVLPVGLEHYQVGWSGRTGESGRSGVRAQYVEESNFYQPAWVTVADIPDASRMLDVEGFYRGELSDSTSLEAGVRYRQLDGQAASLSSLTRDLADETIDLYGVADSQIQPRVLVEYGLFSTVRDGGLSLMPHGGMVVQLGDSDWKARTSASHRIEGDRQEEEGLYYSGFRSAFHSDRDSCRQAGEACYEVTFTHGRQDREQISLGAVHRKFAETLRVYFSPDFFNRLESVFFVDGDTVPELQFRMVRQIAPRVLAKLESNFAAGGGGIFYATDERPYENQVRYLVTSLDTRFQQTSTGVFVAFHHLEQALNPVDPSAEAAPEVEIQRLQLMLTQDLNLLADFAASWAVRFNFELSRGATPYTLTTDDELRKKLTGGLSVSF